MTLEFVHNIITLIKQGMPMRATSFFCNDALITTHTTSVHKDYSIIKTVKPNKAL